MSYMLDHGCNNATIVKGSLSGNIIPHLWYNKITSESGKPDYGAISVFSEIIYWYRPDREGRTKFRGDSWQTSYEHFETRFGYHREKIRRALVRLEELGLIRRELRTIKSFGQKYSNVLFIRLLSVPNTVEHNSDAYSYVHAENLGYKESSLCYGDKYTDHNSQDTEWCGSNSGTGVRHEKIKKTNEKLLLNFESDLASEPCANNPLDSFFVKPLHKFIAPSPQIYGEHYIEENKQENTKNRSDMRISALSESNVSIISDLESKKRKNCNSTKLDNCVKEMNIKDSLQISEQSFMNRLKTGSWKKVTKSFQETVDWPEGRGLLDLASLSDKEVSELNRLSSREFSQNFINQLILKLGYKNPHHKFFKKKSFMNYMAKAIKNEIIQAPQANNIDFKFACASKTAEENFRNRVNQYCEEIESNTSTIPDVLLKKKILGRLDPSIAYEVLNGTVVTVHPNDDSQCIIKTLRPLNIQGSIYQKMKEVPEWIRRTILEEVRVVYGQQVYYIEYDGLNDPNFEKNFNIPNTIGSTDRREIAPNIRPSGEITVRKASENLSPVQLTWEKVKNKLKEIYDDNTYRSWFSNLKVVPNRDNHMLRIEAPTNFIRDWIKKDYGHIVEREIKLEDPCVQFVEFV